MKNKKKLIIDKYSQPIYLPNTVYVIKNYTEEDIISRFKWSDGVEITKEDLKMEYADGLTMAYCYSKDDKEKKLCVLILLNFNANSTTEEKIDIIAHESLHAAQDILQYCSIDLTRDTSEAYAFMVGWLTKCCYQTLKKKSNE